MTSNTIPGKHEWVAARYAAIRLQDALEKPTLYDVSRACARNLPACTDTARDKPPAGLTCLWWNQSNSELLPRILPSKRKDLTNVAITISTHNGSSVSLAHNIREPKLIWATNIRIITSLSRGKMDEQFFSPKSPLEAAPSEDNPHVRQMLQLLQNSPEIAEKLTSYAAFLQSQLEA